MSSSPSDATPEHGAAPVTDADPGSTDPLTDGAADGGSGGDDTAATPAGDDATGAADEADSPDFDPVIDALTTERDLYRDMAQRVQADFDNFRKRARAQAADDVDRATGRFAEALLPVLDACEAAYVGHPDEVGPLLNLLLSELRKLGLETIDLEGKPFDPNLADAVAHEPGAGDTVVVAEVLRSGYTWNGRTLRPAMVRTADGDATPTDD